MRILRTFLLAAAMVGAFALVSGEAMAIEEPRYAVVTREDGVELRRYAPSIVAQTRVEGPREEATVEGFRRLARYIFGGNRARAAIAMTAPVAAAPAASERIAMTAPVAQAPAENGAWTVQFTMPAAWTMETLPVPEDPRVELRPLPERRVLVLAYRGSWSEARRQAHEEQLSEALRQRGLRAAGPLTWARYDPPWKPWFLKRNELWVEVE
jgi:hypothetical protein